LERLARRCQEGGGVAALVYNSEPNQLLNGKVFKGSEVNIPVVSVTWTDGKELVRNYKGKMAVVEKQVGYGFSDGTSAR